MQKNTIVCDAIQEASTKLLLLTAVHGDKPVQQPLKSAYSHVNMVAVKDLKEEGGFVVTVVGSSPVLAITAAGAAFASEEEAAKALASAGIQLASSEREGEKHFLEIARQTDVDREKVEGDGDSLLLRDYFSLPKHITFPSKNDRVAHALLYLPYNPRFGTVEYTH